MAPKLFLFAITVLATAASLAAARDSPKEATLTNRKAVEPAAAPAADDKHLIAFGGVGGVAGVVGVMPIGSLGGSGLGGLPGLPASGIVGLPGGLGGDPGGVCGPGGGLAGRKPVVPAGLP